MRRQGSPLRGGNIWTDYQPHIHNRHFLVRAKTSVGFGGTYRWNMSPLACHVCQGLTNEVQRGFFSQGHFGPPCSLSPVGLREHMAVRSMKVLLAQSPVSAASIEKSNTVLKTAWNGWLLLLLPELQWDNTEGSESPGRRVRILQCWDCSPPQH